MTQLKYTVTLDGDGWHNIVIDLPTGLTIQERKLHRQCLDYKINGGYVYDTNQDAKVKFGTAYDGWAIRAAIRRGRNMWLKMHQDIFKNNPSLKPKWHDFKCRLITPQTGGDEVTDIIPHGGAPTIYRVPEDIFDQNLPHEEAGLNWSLFTTEDHSGQGGSTMTADNDEFSVHLIGDHWEGNSVANKFQSVGLIQSWMESRPDINPVTTVSDAELDDIMADPLNMLFNDGDADNEIIENFHNNSDGDGDQEGDAYPPYDLAIPANLIQERAAATTNVATPVSYFTGFNALLGQVFLRIKVERAGAVDIMFDVDPRGATI